MIVISHDLVLAQIAAGVVDRPLIGWHNIVTNSNIVASSAENGFPASELANPATDLKWRATGNGDQTLTLTTGYVDEINYLAIAGHNFGSAGIPLIVERRDDPLGAYATTLECVLADDAPAILQFPLQSYETLRLTMLSGSEPPEAAVIYVGRLLEIERRLYQAHTPMRLGRKAKSVSGRSESGQFLGRIVTTEWSESTASFSLISPSWYRANLDPFVAASRDTPFFFAWRPASYPRETGYAWLTADPKPVNASPSGLIQVDLQMAGITE